jgi:hypothetical protein
VVKRLACDELSRVEARFYKVLPIVAAIDLVAAEKQGGGFRVYVQGAMSVGILIQESGGRNQGADFYG